MILFQTAYPMIVFLIYCVLAGNTAFVREPSSSLPDLADFLLADFVSLRPPYPPVHSVSDLLLQHPLFNVRTYLF